MNSQKISNWLWWLFLIWTAIGFWVMPFDIGAAEIKSWIDWLPLQNVLLAVLRISDALWMVFAAAFTYFYLVRHEGLVVARRAALIILAGSALLEWIGVKTGYPFGPYIYTDRIGTRIFGLPFTIPLAWLVIVACARYTVLTFREHATRWQIALGTGLLAVLTDISLEWVAWKIRAYWLWYFPLANTPDWPPLQNYLSWFVFATLFAWIAFPGARPVGRHWRPVILLAAINLLFWVTILLRLG